ncbi:MAG: hypothetical protein KF764_34485 [Labilithrix sp.]|nr:hypothetical protein [Labilithrix sp.]
MAHYIKELADRLSEEIRQFKARKDYGFEFQLEENRWSDALGSIHDELNKLDVMLLAPNVRASFILSRDVLRAGAHLHPTYTTDPSAAWEAIAQTLNDLGMPLESYGLALVASRTFVWLADPKLRTIVERDYAEVVVRLLPGGAWKSSVILAGSVCEAILFDVLTGTPARLKRAGASAEVPQSKGKAVAAEDWKLEALIKIARDVKFIDQNREKTFDVGLRHFRNFIHPKREVKEEHACGEGEAHLAVGALIGLCDHFDKNPPPQ